MNRHTSWKEHCAGPLVVGEAHWSHPNASSTGDDESRA